MLVARVYHDDDQDVLCRLPNNLKSHSMLIGPYGVHLRTKIIENKRQFDVQKLDYPCRNLVIWIWKRNERSRNSIIRTWSYFEQVETINGKLDIADVEVQITIPTKMQITWFELQFTFSTLISHLIVNNATIIFHKIPIAISNSYDEISTWLV